MNRPVLGLIAAICLIPACSASDPATPRGAPPAADPPPLWEPPLVQYVDPFIGSGGDGFGVGSAFAGATAPFGLVKLGADTVSGSGAAPGFSHCAGYAHGDRFVRGFGHIHLHGTGLPDYGNLLLLPSTLSDAELPGHRVQMDKATEDAGPGWYHVTLADGVRVELTAGDRHGVTRITWPDGADRIVHVDMGHALGTGSVPESELVMGAGGRGFSGMLHNRGEWSGRFGGFRLWFAAEADAPLERVADWEHGVTLRAGGDGAVELRVGVSFTDAAGAAANFDESQGFEATRLATEARWEELLGRVRFGGGSAQDAAVLYTAVYHSLLMPTLLSDADGRYRGLDQEIHATAPGSPPYYTDFSLWDTYRTLHPLLSVLYPEYQRDFLISFQRMADDGGFVPKWPLAIGYTGTMLGTSADVVVADAAVKGVSEDGFSYASLYEALLRTADGPTPAGSRSGGRGCMPAYVDHGFCPMEHDGGSVARTLEFGWDDFALGKLAGHLGEAGDAERFAARATAGWRHHVDPDSGFLVERSQDGAFHPPGDMLAMIGGGYVEGNAWHYQWLAPHDVAGLVQALGGTPAFIDKLGRFFEGAREAVDEATRAGRAIDSVPNPYYWHGNEPDLHAPWLFSAVGRPDLTSDAVRWVAGTYYDDTPSGLAGNDDCGTLSAWYLFAAAGLFPVAGSTQYLLNAPLFDYVRWEPPGKPALEFRSTASVGDHPYPVGAWAGGQRLQAAAVDHDTVVAGRGLLFELADQRGDPWLAAPPP